MNEKEGYRIEIKSTGEYTKRKEFDFTVEMTPLEYVELYGLMVKHFDKPTLDIPSL